MVTTFTYCRSSRKSLGNAAHMSARHTATRSNANGTYTKKGSGQEFRRNSLSPFLFTVPQEPFATWLYLPAADYGSHLCHAHVETSAAHTQSLQNWRALNPPLAAPKPYRGRSSAGHHISHHIASNHSRALVSSVKIGFWRFAVMTECSGIIPFWESGRTGGG
jgi:hypothetical protein